MELDNYSCSNVFVDYKHTEPKNFYFMTIKELSQYWKEKEAHYKAEEIRKENRRNK